MLNTMTINDVLYPSRDGVARCTKCFPKEYDIWFGWHLLQAAEKATSSKPIEIKVHDGGFSIEFLRQIAERFSSDWLNDTSRRSQLGYAIETSNQLNICNVKIVKCKRGKREV